MTHAHWAIIAAALTLAGPAAAEPTRTQPVESAQAPNRAVVVMAAADQAIGSAPAIEKVNTPPKRPRAARVTSCRCGDPQTQQQEP